MPRLFAAFALALLIASCATGPQYPLYSPLAVTGTFGYSEQQLSDTSYRITYVTPRSMAYNPYEGAEPRRTELLTLANDMAMMRAAELAQEHGQQTFRVIQRDNDADVNREQYYSPCNDPFYVQRPYYYPFPPRLYRCGPEGYTYFQGHSTITVEFGHKPGDELYVTQDVLNRLGARRWQRKAIETVFAG